MNDIRRKITELAHALYYLADELVAEPTKQNAKPINHGNYMLAHNIDKATYAK